jgi:GNAT superfamily N-acetyltransferase
VAPVARVSRVAEVDGRVVGFSTYERVGDALEVVDLFVDPDAMRGGVGRALVEDLVDQSGELGAVALEVTGNPNALPLYLAVGFEVVGEAATEGKVAPRLRRPSG